jgi:hypothetical protein
MLKILALIMVVCALIMTVAVVVMVINGAHFVPIMLAPLLFIGLGAGVYRVATKRP